MPNKGRRIGVSVITESGPRQMPEPMQTTKPPGPASKVRSSRKAGVGGSGSRSESPKGG